MASPSQPTPSSSYFSIQSIISADDRSSVGRQSGSPQTHATTPNSALSPGRHVPGIGLGPNSTIRPPLETSPPLPQSVDLHQHQYQSPLPHQPQHQMRRQQHSYYQHTHQQQQQYQRQHPQQQQYQQHLPSISSVPPLPHLPPPSSLPQPHTQPIQDQQDNGLQFLHTHIQQASHHRRIPEGHLNTFSSLHQGVGGRATREAQDHEQVAASPSTYGYPSPSAGVPDSPSPSDVTKKIAVAKRAPMRSSIACIRCRRSKIKCVNNGEGKAACETCLKTRRDCDYPVSSNQTSMADSGLQFVHTTVTKSSATLKREDPGPTERNMERKRLKKVDDSCRLDDQKVGAYNANELLSEQFLKEMMWTEIFDIFSLHFSTELPFIHMPTLKEKMGDKLKARRSDATNLVLLGILTLTARFHSDLSKYTASFIANGSKSRTTSATKLDPWTASEYFADTLTRALGPFRTSVSIVSVEHVQALLMLGLYEWTQSKRRNAGISAWMTVGFAIRMAQGLGLPYEREADRDPDRRHHRLPATTFSGPAAAIAEAETEALASPSSSPFHTAAQKSASVHSSFSEGNINKPISITAPDENVANEVVRRTMFSCFVLDRMLACGQGRTSMVRSKDLRIQLPCSEVDFDLSIKVETGFLRPRLKRRKALAAAQASAASTDSLLARFIRLADIWGDISRYSFAGGRLKEKRPPWEASKFRKLRGLLDGYYESLPPTFTLSQSNYHRHEHLQASSTYVSLHMLGAVCQIMLHREYIPFIPIRCQRPMGPLDEPTFPEGSAPYGFWEESAERVFQAAREIVDLAEICQTRKKMPMSALVVFSVWTAAFVGIYARHFPQLDMKHHMSSAEELGRNQTRTSKIGKGRENQAATHSPTTIAYTTLTSMTNYLHMASTYVKHFHFMDQFYEKVINDYGAHVEKHGGPAVGKTSVRQGGNGGGLDEWKLHGLKVINNGTLLSAEDQLADTSDLEKESSRSDKDNDAAESCLTPVDDHSRKPRWIAPAGSKPNSAAAKVAGTSPKGDQQHNGSVAQDVAMKDQGDGISAGTSVAPEGDIQGVVFGNESDSRSLGGTVGDSANGGNLESVQGHQQWAQYTEPPDPVHQVPHLNSQGLGTSDAMLLTQVGSLDPALQGAYLVNGPATDARMSYNAAEIFEFLALNESNRWEGELQAASIGHFAQGDFEGGSLWNVVPYPVGFPEYQE